jgi:UDP-N-acetylglucosamine--dolichyl-phosphate N-acetylglucosaminephosphotransferase
MMELILFFVPLALSIIFVYFFGKSNQKNGIIGKDINKLDQRIIPEAAGIALLVPLWFAILTIGLFFQQEFNMFYFIFGLLVSAFAFIGLMDDTKHKFMMKTTPWTFRAIPVIFVSLIFGAIHFHDPVWAVMIALFVAGLASFENTFAGLNGWEVGSGLIISLFVTLIVSTSLDPNLVLLSLALNGMILGLLFWNKFPARVFPGDSGTLFIGSSIAALLVMNQRFEMVLLGALFFLPHFVDFFLLKLLTNPRDVSQSKSMPYAILPNGKLAIPKTGNGSKLDFAKLILKIFGPLKEWQVVTIIWIITIANCLFWSKLFGII